MIQEDCSADDIYICKLCRQSGMCRNMGGFLSLGWPFLFGLLCRFLSDTVAFRGVSLLSDTRPFVFHSSFGYVT